VDTVRLIIFVSEWGGVVHRAVGAAVLMGMICLGGMLSGWMIRVRPMAPDSIPVFLPDTVRRVTPLLVPRTPALPPSSFASDPLAFLSRAPADSLDLLPGIGPVLAARIIEARRVRPFTSWVDVDAVKGVGPKMLARWQDLSTRQ
jgi:hypothetical protein